MNLPAQVARRCTEFLVDPNPTFLKKTNHPRRSFRETVGLALLFLLCAQANVRAQAHAAGVEALDHWRGGVSIAIETLPRAVDPTCGKVTGHRSGSVLGVHVLAPVGRLQLEANARWHLPPGLLCGGPIVDDDGLVTTYTTGRDVDAFATTGLRARLGLGPDEWFVLGLGGGWAWTKHVPYISASLGVRTGSTIRWGVDVVGHAYRVPWTRTTTRYAGGVPESIVQSESYEQWDVAIGVRFAVEVPLPG